MHTPTRVSRPAPPHLAGERTVSIVEGGMGFAPCEPGTAVSRISRPIYGNAAAGCNATDTYM